MKMNEDQGKAKPVTDKDPDEDESKGEPVIDLPQVMAWHTITNVPYFRLSGAANELRSQHEYFVHMAARTKDARIVLYANQSLNPAYVSQTREEIIQRAAHLDLNKEKEFCAWFVEILPNDELKVLLLERPRDIDQLTGFLHDLRPEDTSTTQGMLDATQQFLFEQIANQNYAGINKDAFQRWQTNVGNEKIAVQQYIREQYYTNTEMRIVHAKKVTDFMELMQTAHVVHLVRGLYNEPKREGDMPFGKFLRDLILKTM